MGHAETAALIAERLTREAAPLHLEVTDDSASHAGHEGAKSGGGHFEVTLVSSLFVGTDRMSRHPECVVRRGQHLPLTYCLLICSQIFIVSVFCIVTVEA